MSIGRSLKVSVIGGNSIFRESIGAFYFIFVERL